MFRIYRMLESVFSFFHHVLHESWPRGCSHLHSSDSNRYVFRNTNRIISFIQVVPISHIRKIRNIRVRNLDNRARLNHGGFLNTNVSNFSNAGECVFFFPPRITRILAAWAALTCIRKIRIDSCFETRIELFHSYR